MKVIVGLGNPGPRYAKTRHNVGHRVVETLARQSGATWKGDKALKSRCSKIQFRQTPLVLALPSLFMNESGEAVRAVVSAFEINISSDLLVAVDDVALSFGRLRMRPRGSDGGHRGLKSIVEALESEDFARLRVGIAPSAATKGPLEKYVLSPFKKNEEEVLSQILDRAAEACRQWVGSAIERAMDWTNKPLESEL